MPELFTKAYLSKRVGLTEEEFQRLVNEGVIHNPDRGDKWSRGRAELVVWERVAGEL